MSYFNVRFKKKLMHKDDQCCKLGWWLWGRKKLNIYYPGDMHRYTKKPIFPKFSNHPNFGVLSVAERGMNFWYILAATSQNHNNQPQVVLSFMKLLNNFFSDVTTSIIQRHLSSSFQAKQKRVQKMTTLRPRPSHPHFENVSTRPQIFPSLTPSSLVWKKIYALQSNHKHHHVKIFSPEPFIFVMVSH